MYSWSWEYSIMEAYFYKLLRTYYKYNVKHFDISFTLSILSFIMIKQNYKDI